MDTNINTTVWLMQTAYAAALENAKCHIDHWDNTAALAFLRLAEEVKRKLLASGETHKSEFKSPIEYHVTAHCGDGLYDLRRVRGPLVERAALPDSPGSVEAPTDSAKPGRLFDFGIPAAHAIVHMGNAYLVIRRWDSLFGLPGGNIDPGETPEDAIRRELREEIALETDALVHAYTTIHEGRGLSLYTVEVDSIDRVVAGIVSARDWKKEVFGIIVCDSSDRLGLPFAGNAGDQIEWWKNHRR